VERGGAEGVNVFGEDGEGACNAEDGQGLDGEPGI